MYGLAVQAGFDLAGLPDDEPDAREAPAALELADAEARFSGPGGYEGTLRLGDGERVTILYGRDGDALLRHRDAAFHVAPRGAAIAAHPADPAEPGWQRVLADTVLGVAALLRGREALHAAAVEVDGAVVAITAGSGAGKTTLCGALLDAGGRLVSDDMVFLDGRLAFRGPPLMSVPPGLQRLGTVLADFGDERWIRVDARASANAPLDLVVVLDRRSGAGAPRLAPVDAPLGLLGALLDSGPFPERRRARFELAADLLAALPVLRLTVDAATPASETAAAVRRAVAA
jgi:hypothetical protein